MKFRSAVVAITVTTTAALSALGLPSGSQGAPLPLGNEPHTAGTATVTLITGDRVLVTTDQKGRPSAMVLPGGGDPDGYLTRAVGKNLYVTPARAVPLLRAGRLDPELFDVTGLVAQGYDDVHRRAIPVLATYSRALSARAAPLQGLRGATVAHTFANARLAALDVDKQETSQFWAALSAPAAPRAAASSAIVKVWLDRKLHADLADSVGHIGAPQAWAAGFDGTGVKVAVLDTGYDDTHPDLVGQIAAAEDFTGSGSAVDQNGHGTHVASTIAGTGAASGGRERGVAPGSKLLIGRVLGADGFGQESWIIAGMEWAAAQGAAVVSMSLGGDDPDCADPLSEEVDTLSKSSNSLFVIAAGNEGTVPGSLNSPGCADSALTVAATDLQDVTAFFSSRGPVLGDHRLKPDIAAPGVDILAAALGSPGGDPYVSLSGTSMATPHVAGAVAILAQQRPTWTAQQRKAALISAARPDAKDGVYAQGAGVVDVPRLMAHTVFGSGTVNLGAFTWPHNAQATVTKDLTYTNDGDEARTLQLALADITGQDGKPLAAGTLSLGASSVTVPAHGTATVSLTLDPSIVQPDSSYGNEGGRLIARGSDGDPIITPVGFWLEPHIVTVTVRTIDRHGHSANDFTGFVDLVDLDSGTGERRFLFGEDNTFRVPAGTMSIVAMISDREGGAPSPAPLVSLSYVGRPELSVHDDMTVVLDARTAVAQRITGTRPIESHSVFLQYGRVFGDNLFSSGGVATRQTGVTVYEAASDAVRTGTFEVDSFNRMFAPELPFIGSSRGTVLHPVYFDSSARLDGTRSAQLVDGGDGAPDRLTAAKVAGKVVLIHVASSFDAFEPVADATAAGAKAILVATDDATGRWEGVASVVTNVPALAITTAEAASLVADLAEGRTSITWNARGASPYVYNLAFVAKGAVVPASQRIDESRMGRVEEDWSIMRVPGSKVDSVGAIRPDFPGVATLGGNPVPAPSHRTQFFTADDTTWQQSAATGGVASEFLVDKPRRYAAGQVRSQSWYRGPLTIGPVKRDADWSDDRIAERQGNQISANVAFWRDTDPDHFGMPGFFIDNGAAELSVDGKSLGVGSLLGPFGQWTVPSGGAAYTLRVDTSRSNPGGPLNPAWRMSFGTTTIWRFHSTTPTGGTPQTLPVLLPTYDLRLDALNLAPASNDFKVQFGATGQRDYNAGNLVSARAWVSYDDGATWTTAPVTASHGAFVARVHNRAAAHGYVSLRIEVTDSHGASVDQTIIRAYGVR